MTETPEYEIPRDETVLFAEPPPRPEVVVEEVQWTEPEPPEEPTEILYVPDAPDVPAPDTE